MSKEKPESTALIIPGETALSALRENLGDEGISIRVLPRLKIPAGGGLFFEIPTADGQGKSEKIVEGIILDALPSRALWMEPFGGGAEPPACFSTDGKTGIGDPGGKCVSCQFNQWGSIALIDPTKGSADKGKACGERKLLPMLLPGKALPAVISLPPTSIKPWDEYKIALAFEDTAYWQTTTKVSLTKDKSKGGIDYSKAAFQKGTPIDPSEIPRLKAFRENILSIIKESHQAGVIDVQDYEVTN